MSHILSWLSNDVRAIIYRELHKDAYRAVRQQFEVILVPHWHDVHCCFHINVLRTSIGTWSNRPLALWRSLDDRDRFTQSSIIYSDIWILIYDKRRKEVCSCPKDLVYCRCMRIPKNYYNQRLLD